MTTAGAGGPVLAAKAREPRRKVLLHGRMQAGDNWVNVTIHNVSSRGLMGQCASRVERGNYVDIRHRSQVIVGRVVWTQRGRFGLRTRDPIDLADLIGEPAPALVGERRRRGRASSPVHKPAAAERYLASRHLSSMFQFVGIAIVLAAIALVLAERVHSLLVQPLGLARTAMSVAAGQAEPMPVAN